MKADGYDEHVLDHLTHALFFTLKNAYEKSSASTNLEIDAGKTVFRKFIELVTI